MTYGEGTRQFACALDRAKAPDQARPTFGAAQAGRCVVAGCGDVFLGDWGVALYELAGLRQEPLAADVLTPYVARAYHCLPVAMHEARAAMVIAPACVTGHVGMIHMWDMAGLIARARGAEAPRGLRPLAQAMVRLEFGFALPETLLFAIIDVEGTEEVGLSARCRQAARKIVGLARRFLETNGACAPRRHVARLYHIPWLNIAY